jgi:menaquinone-dependent protoporphyrinogen oxidase
MSQVLVVYGTSYGQTGKVVERIARDLTHRGHRVTVWKGDNLPTHYRLDDFDGFVIAGSVQFGKHQSYLTDFVKQHASRINPRPAVFVSVCGALAGSWARGEIEAQKYVARFCEETGLLPGIARSVAGALPYTRYSFPVRWVMKLISRATGRPTDTSRDWEFTDWDQVDRIAAEFAADLASAAPRAETVPAKE